MPVGASMHVSKRKLQVLRERAAGGDNIYCGWVVSKLDHKGCVEFCEAGLSCALHGPQTYTLLACGFPKGAVSASVCTS